MRRIFIHAGFSKTGSSAIQCFLESNKQFLQDIGLKYNSDNIDLNEINSGNSERLFYFITQSNYNEVKNFLLKNSSTDIPSILSSETLGFLTSDQWDFLKEICDECSIAIEKIIFYVRDVDKFMISSYDQGLKRHGMSLSFLDYASSHEWTHYESCMNLSRSFDSDVLVPLHYDSCCKNLLGSFFSQICDISPNFKNLIDESQKKRINRSLTNLEREYLKKINTKFSMVYSEKISNMLLAATPDKIDSEYSIDEDTRQGLQKRFQGQVDWVNNYFFGNKPLVCCLSKSTLAYPESSEGIFNPQDENTYRLLLEFLIEEVANSNTSIIGFLIDKIINIKKQSQPVPEDFPEDFSFLDYAILNLDVLFADVDLKEHYIKNGKEEGRLYSIK
jgi:hypothetical protein